MKVARISVAVAIASVLIAGSALADRTLWLQTNEGTLPVPLKQGQNMSVLADGDVSAVASDDFVCSSEPEGPDCEDVDVSLTDNFSFFSISPSTVSHGSTVTMTWRSRGAWECVGGGLPGTTWNSGNPRVPAGQTSISTNPLDGDSSYVVSLECSNGPVTATRTANLNVTSGDNGGGGQETPESCTDRTLLGDVSGWSLANDVRISGSSDPTDYFGVFSAPPFPGSSNSFGFYLPQGRYAAMQFTVPSSYSSNEQGAWNLSPITSSPGTYGAGLMFIAISDCPGDFNVNNLPEASCGRVYDSLEGKHVTRWSTDPNSSRCSLEPGKTYYMNVAYVSSVDASDFPPLPSSCGGAPNCGGYLQALPGG